MAKYSFAILLLGCITFVATQKPTLTGVTIQSWPYADKINNTFEGFVVDLMNRISNISNINYELHYSSDAKYGVISNGTINGMLGEVYNNKSDFAIADITVTEARKEFVDFTEPFMENQLAALVRRENAEGFEKLEDLSILNDTDSNSSLTTFETQNIHSFGVIRTGSTHAYFHESTDPIGAKMYSWLSRHPESLVGNAKEGFSRVNSGKYAFIVESTLAEYLTGIYCNITILPDTRSMYPRQYAIALSKGSPYLEPFNKAINQLKADGTIAQLKAKYWVNRCADPEYDSEVERANLGPNERGNNTVLDRNQTMPAVNSTSETIALTNVTTSSIVQNQTTTTAKTTDIEQ